MTEPASPPGAGETEDRYRPAGNGDRVTLAVLRSEVVHGFRHIDTKLDTIEACQLDQGDRIGTLERDLAVLNATALKLSAIKLSAILGAILTITLGLATVIAKLGGLW